MIGDDILWIRKVFASGMVEGPVLEMGTGYGGATCQGIVREHGMDHLGTDMTAGANVDVVADFEKATDMAAFAGTAPFGAILSTNVLEHTFDPIRVLDNASTLLRPNGMLILIAPAVWPLHNFPMDAWRLLPNFFEEYAKRRGLELVESHFDFVGKGPVRSFRNVDGSYAFPPPAAPPSRFRYGRLVHRLFHTFGRGMLQPSHVGVGCVLRRA